MLNTFWKKLINNPICFLILRVIEFIYKFILLIRNRLFDLGFKIKKVDAYVISVGNITLGGTGKTPVVIALAKHLKSKGKNIAVLSRGYKNADEPKMFSQILPDVPILINKNRRASAELAIKKYNAEFIILDDGYQHRKLFRDLNILLVDATNPFGNYHVFPAGILREQLSELKRADVVILTKTNFINDLSEIKKQIYKYNSGAEILESKVEAVDMGFIKGKNVILISAIGNPKFFKQQIELLGANIQESIEYQDHHSYCQKDVDGLNNLYKKINPDFIITTHKDKVKLDEFAIDLPLIFMPIEHRIINCEELFENILRGEYKILKRK